MIRYGLTTRSDGNMLVAIDDEIFKVGEGHRQQAMAKLGVKKFVVCRLAHGISVRQVHARDDQRVQWGADALVTKDKNIFCGLTVADCLPVFFSDESHGVVGLAHAGWRGIVSGLIPATLKELMACGAKHENIKIEVGAGIHECHFEVKKDVLPRFSLYPRHIKTRYNRHFIDLYGVVQDQLLLGGILQENIRLSDECTFCLPQKYFSYRRDHSNPPEAMLAYIGRTDA